MTFLWAFFIHFFDCKSHDDIRRHRQDCICAVGSKQSSMCVSEVHILTNIKKERYRGRWLVILILLSGTEMPWMHHCKIKRYKTTEHKIPFNCCFIALRFPKSNPKQAFNLNSKQVCNDIKRQTPAQKHDSQATRLHTYIKKSQMWVKLLKRHRWGQNTLCFRPWET